MPTVRTIDVKDAAEVTRSLATMPDPGSAADAASLPVTKSTEDKAVSAAIKTAVETVAGAVDATKVKAKVADGDDAALGAKADASAGADTGTFSLIAFVKWIASKIKAVGQAAMAASHPVVIASDQTAVAVKTGGETITAEFTRPSDTTAYAANDVVGYTGTADTTLLAAIFRENGATGYIVKAELWTDKVDVTAPFRLYLFNAEPTPIADNSPFTLLYADIAKCVGYIDLTNVSQEGASSTAALGLWTGQLFVKADASADDLYAVLVTKAIFTPASAQKFTIRLSMDRN